MATDPRNEEMRIYYGPNAFSSFEASIQCEQEMHALLRRYGLYCWASGTSIGGENIRDIAYDRRVEDDS